MASIQYWCSLGKDEETNPLDNVDLVWIRHWKVTSNSSDGNKHQIDILNERQRQIVVPHEWEGYTLDEISQIMDIPLGTIKSGLFRAKEKLLTNLSETNIEIAKNVKHDSLDRDNCQ